MTCAAWGGLRYAGARVRLLIATTSRDKLPEIRDILRGLPIDLLTLEDVRAVPPPAETGASFAANAREKALHYAAAHQELTVAEDSGFEIDALGGRPGIHSARFPGATYVEKFAGIYRLLGELGLTGSRARFVCALALAEPGRIVFEATGTIEGEVSPAPRGSGGFGYDPIFYYPPLGCTAAEMSPADKAAVSHRGRAFRELRAHLARLT